MPFNLKPLIPQQWLRQLGVLICCGGEARPQFRAMPLDIWYQNVARLPVARSVARCPIRWLVARPWPVARCPWPVARCPLPVARGPLPVARGLLPVVLPCLPLSLLCPPLSSFVLRLVSSVLRPLSFALWPLPSSHCPCVPWCFVPRRLSSVLWPMPSVLLCPHVPSLTCPWC